MTSSHPFIVVEQWKPFPIRPLPPIYPPPEPLNYPSLPLPPRSLPFNAPFTLSTHIIPAAHIRRGVRIPFPDLPSRDAERKQKTKQFAEVNQSFHRHALDPDIANSKHDNALWNVLNRYVRKGLDASNSTGITLLFAHAIGYPKELWEPILGRIFALDGASMIDEVWTWESIQHGDAGIINSNALTCFFDWTDNTRDLLNFLLHFLPSTPLEQTIPVHLNRVPLTETQERINHGFQHRKLIAIGHSYGATCLAFGAVHYPKLQSSLILADPVMLSPTMPEEIAKPVYEWGRKASFNALVRRDTWESKEEAYKEFSSSRFYAAWDRDMLKAYIEHGLYETTVKTSSGEEKPVVKLKLTPLHEAVTFASGDAPMEMFSSLPRLDERIKLHWIMSGAEGAPEFGPPGSQQERVWVRPKNASNTRITRAGHLVPQEGTVEFAQEIIKFLYCYYQPIRASL